MARGLHYKTSPQDIISDLTAQGYEVINAVNILCNKTKKPLNLFMLTFNENRDPKTVFEIKIIDYQKVKIEELRKTTNRIVQCKNYQDFNHVQSYCQKKPKCVKCAGLHKTAC